MRSNLPEQDPLLSLHTFSLGGRDYAVEGFTGTGLELEGEVNRALAALRRAACRGERSLQSSAESSFPRDLLAKLGKLRQTVLRYAEGAKRLRWDEAWQRSPKSMEVCLCATFRCNLACRYCFVRLAGRDRSDIRGDMTPATARAAIDFALERLQVPTGELIVSFGHTGEPLLARELYEKTGEYVHLRAAETGRNIAYGMAATNFTLTHQSGALPRLSWPSISLDGPRELHDEFRITPDGHGTYDLIVPALRKLLAIYPEEAAQANIVATITRRSTDIRGIFLHLASLGAPFVTMYPVRLPPDAELAISEAAAEELLAGYDDLLRHLLALDEASLTRDLKCMVHSQDYFGRHVLRIALNHRICRRCEAGIYMCAVTPDGSIFPCPELAALGKHRIGSIGEGLDEVSRERLRSRRVWDDNTCAACWARLLCGGDCLSNRAMYEPFGKPPDPGMCTFTRGLIEKAIHLVTRLRQTRPEVLADVLKSRAGWLMDARRGVGEGDSSSAAP